MVDSLSSANGLLHNKISLLIALNKFANKPEELKELYIDFLVFLHGSDVEACEEFCERGSCSWTINERKLKFIDKLNILKDKKLDGALLDIKIKLEKRAIDGYDNLTFIGGWGEILNNQIKDYFIKEGLSVVAEGSDLIFNWKQSCINKN